MIKELFSVKDTLANKISYYHLMLFMLSLPFDRFYSHVILVSFAIHTLIHLSKKEIKPIFTRRTLVLQAVFFVTAISTIYTVNRTAAFKDWELYIPVLLFPILFCLNPLDLKRYQQQLFLAFAMGSAATILYLYFDAFRTIIYYHLPISSILSPAFTNQNFSVPIDMHATFFSMQIVVALVYMLSILIKEWRMPNKVFYSICFLILAAGVIQLSSKSVVVALFLIINIAFPLFLLKDVARKRFIIIAASMSVLLIIGIFNSHSFKARYLTELKQDLSKPIVGETTDPRLSRWEISAELIKKSPIIGYGAGSEIGLLQDQYFARKYYRSYLNRLNAHNEYLSFLIKSGIWGLAVYLAILVYGFKIAIRKKDIVFFSFMMLLAIVSLSENILDVDKGVMFYSFFFAYFVFVAEQKEKLQIPIKRHKYLRKVATNHIIVPS